MSEVIIERIVEETVEIIYGQGILGKVYSHLELNNVLIQIRDKKLTGYSVKKGNLTYLITKDGRVENGGQPKIYPILGEQLRNLI